MRIDKRIVGGFLATVVLVFSAKGLAQDTSLGSVRGGATAPSPRGGRSSEFVTVDGRTVGGVGAGASGLVRRFAGAWRHLLALLKRVWVG